MLKRVLMFTLCFLLLISFSSCGLFDDEPLDPNLENKVDYISTENGEIYIKYEDAIFLPHTEELFSIDEPDADVLLGWSGFWWGYINQYHSCQATNPIYIYETRMDNLYLRSDYNFSEDLFVIEGSSSEIIFSSALKYDHRNSFDGKVTSGVEIILYSKTCPKLKIHLQIFPYKDIWYALTKQDEIYIVSEEMTNILIENKVISY